MFRKKLILTLFWVVLLTSCNYPDWSDPTSPAQPTASEAAPTSVPAATPQPTPSPTYAPPAGYKDYSDPPTGITISIPEGWWITGVIEGEYAILQSYHPDKYVGGEAFQAGDTKCDLNILEDASNPESVLEQWTADGRTEILSQQEITLPAGSTALRLELQSMGTSQAQIAQLDPYTVTLICFGDPAPFEEIADTLR